MPNYMTADAFFFALSYAVSVAASFTVVIYAGYQFGRAAVRWWRRHMVEQEIQEQVRVDDARIQQLMHSAHVQSTLRRVK